MYKTDYKVRTADADKNGELKFSALLLMLQEAGAEHAEILKVGYAHLKDKNLGWALAKMAMHVEEIPRWGERISIQTWVSESTKITTYREFLVNGADERPLFKVRTQWVLFNTQKRRIERIDLVKELLEENPKKACEEDFLEKLEPAQTRTHSAKMFALKNDIDMNCHVNNAVYLSWAFEALPDDIIEKFAPKKIRIDFLDEVALRNDVDSVCQIVEGEKFLKSRHSILNLSKASRDCARVNIDWNPRNSNA